jgi:imidazolonepropionase-like amidohydrolase
VSGGVEIRTSKLVVGDGRVYEDCRVGVRDGVIQEVTQGHLQETYEVVRDFRGKTIMPGIIDAHVHLRYGPKKDTEDLPDDYQAIRAVTNMKKALASGATTLIDAGGIRNMTFSLRRAQIDGLVEGPRLFVCGEMITITGGRSSKPGVRLYEVDGADSARNAARRLLMHHNADFIKLGATGAISASHTGPRHPQLSLEEMTTICEEAHECGRMVHAHCYGREGIRRALASGVDVIVHGQTLSDGDIDNMLTGGKLLIPTLKPYLEAIEGDGDQESKIRLLETGIWDETEPNFKKALAAGVKVALGTDSGMPRVYFGAHSTELEYMVRWGMTKEHAIAAGTINAAKTIGMGDRLGTLEPGKAADLLVLGRDPLKDISAIRKDLEAIMLGGNFIKEVKI